MRRYGGDEFVIIIENSGENAFPDQVAFTLRSILAEKQKKNRLPYDLKISVGYDEFRNDDDSVQACLARADEKLYEEKRAKKSTRR